MNRSNNDSLFASSMQTSMLLPSLLGHESQPYVQQFRWTFLEDVNQQLLKKAWQRVLKRHDTFFHTFEFGDSNRLCIKKSASLQVIFKSLDWSHLPRANRTSKLSAYLKDDLNRGFDMRDGKLSRIQLIRFHSKYSELIWTTHHALFDGRGRQLLIQEFIEVYRALQKGESIRLKKGSSYESYLKWTQDQTWKTSTKFWKKQLGEFEESTSLNFGLEFRGRKQTSNQQSFKTKFITKGLSAKLKSWSSKQETSINILGQAAWGMFLHLSTGSDTVIFGAPRACRKSNVPTAESTVGLFVNTVPVVVKISESETTSDYIQNIKDNWISLREHENTPLPIIQRASKIPNKKPLFESLIGYEKYQLNQLAGNDARSRYKFSLTGHTDIPFSIQLKDGERLQLEVAYSNGRFSEKSVGEVMKSFIHLLEQLTASSRPITKLELLDKNKRARIIYLGTGTKPRILSISVHQAFEKQASESPKAPVFRFKGKSSNYREVNKQSNRLARYLKSKGLKKGDCVGILLERSEMPFIAQLAILKVGCYYMPLDPEYPEDRLIGMIKDAKPRFILTEKELRSKASSTPASVINVDTLNKRLQTFSARNLKSEIEAGDPAYIMFTSGSTGEPKGVVVPHRAILRLVKKPNYVKLSAQTRCLQMATVSFDASTFEVWAPLLNGGCCIIYPERLPSIHALEEILEKESVNTLWLTASLFNFIVENAPEILIGVKQLLAGGEALSPTHIRKAQKALPHTRLINGYGPTENTTFSCCYPIPKGQSSKLSVPIGPPISHSSCYVLNKQMKLLPMGSSGELYVGGDGVALGYLNNPELTESKFVPDPFSKSSQARLYKTGDRAYQREDGSIAYIDRFDDQVKIRGFRIEPMEIQNRLIRMPGIKECAVLVNKNHREENELVAFIVSDQRKQLEGHQLTKQLEAELPAYMIPTGIYFLPSLPLSKTGKVNRRTLLASVKSKGTKKKFRTKNLDKQEKVLWGIWKNILGNEPESPYADFFGAGGHSLLATNFIHNVQTHFNVHIAINEFYQHSSIRKIAHLLERLQRDSKEDRKSRFVIKPSRTKALEPLSTTFKTIYNPEVVRPQSTPTNHIVRAIELDGEVKPTLLIKALEYAVNNHERYRTYTVEIGGEYFEKLSPHVSIKTTRNNFSKLSKKSVNQKLRNIYQRMCQDWVSVRDEPMFRVSLSKLPQKRYFFCLSVNHSICDGNSFGILFRETAQAYNQLIRNRPVSLPKPKFSFKEYEKSLQQWLDAGNEDRIKKFWKKKLRKLEPIDYPFLKKNLPNGIQWNEFDHYKIDPFWADKIKIFTEKNHVSTYIFFLTLVKWMNSRYTGNLDSYVASSTNVRSGESQEHIAGDMVSVLLLRNQLKQNKTFLEQLKLDQETLYEAMDNRTVGVNTVAKPLKEGGINIHKVGGQCRVSYAPDLESELSLDGINTKACLRTRVPARMRFGFIIRELGDDLLVAFQHAPEIYIKHGLDRLKVNLQNFLKLILENPETTLSELPDLTKPPAYKRPVTAAEKRASFIKPIKYLESPPSTHLK